MNPSSDEVVTAGLERLERQCQRWRWIGTSAVLALAVVVAGFAVRRNDASGETRSETLWIIDKHGRGLIRIGSDPQENGHGLIEFLDESGKARMAMGLAAGYNPVVQLWAREGRDYLTLDAGDDRGVAITLKDRKRDSGLLLTTSPDGVAAQGFMSPGGKRVFDLGVNPDGSARLTIRDTEGNEIVRLPKP